MEAGKYLSLLPEIGKQNNKEAGESKIGKNWQGQGQKQILSVL